MTKGLRGFLAILFPYVSLEMEGKEPPATAVPKSLDVLRAAFGG